MSPTTENQVDRIVPSTPGAEPAATALPPLPARQPARTPPATRGSVMDTLLGKHDLAAPDEGGRDPYNATGRQFRR
jgi:hypothetical protein